jgi:hypothetical protein
MQRDAVYFLFADIHSRAALLRVASVRERLAATGGRDILVTT